MWQRCNLQLPTTNTRGGNASFLLSGTKIAVHNWTHGKQEASGKYLSPENAAKVVAAKFGDYADPFALIAQLQAVKKAREQANTDFLQKVSEMRPLEVWAFQAQGQLDVIAQNLQQNIPTAENVYSFLMFFVGENLSGLQQLLRATDEHNNR